MNGNILLSVHTDNSIWKRRAKEVLNNTGATDIGVEREARADYQKSERPVERNTGV